MKMGFNPASDFMFNSIPIFVGLIFVIVIGIFIFTIGKGISEYASNKSKAVETKPARVIGKRPHTWGGTGNTSAHTSYYMTFELENGERLEMPVKSNFYGMHVEGDVGMLTYQGTQMIGFERETV
jgi:NADH:ubiquinone oxidoreductase subunit 3 (subunit A)